MPSYPNRCQHIKVNGTQCGSPALRRNRFCYFHKRHHEEQIELNSDRGKATRARRRKAAIALPVLEDANSIQVSLMQIMRLIVAGHIDNKTAGLLLYALQTASFNLRRTNFEPYRNNVILDPAAVGEIPLGAYAWDDSDFEEDDDENDDEEEDQPEENEPESIKALKAKYGPIAAALNFEPPASQTSAKTGTKTEAKTEKTRTETKTEKRRDASANLPTARKIPPKSTQQIREQIGEMIREAAPELLAAQAAAKNAARSG
jgi:hypothetical protein